MGGTWWVAWVSRVYGSKRGGFLETSYPEHEARDVAELRNVMYPKEHSWALERPEYKQISKTKAEETF